MLLQKQFQPLLASEDYETFKAMMIQKNVDLELQALELLQKRLGQSLDVYQQQDVPSPTPKEKMAAEWNAQEEKDLRDALQLSLKESDSKRRADDEEMERLLELAIQESLRLYQMQEASGQEQEPHRMQEQQKRQEEQHSMEESIVAATQRPIAEKRQVQTVPEESKLPDLTRETSKHSLIPLKIAGSESGELGGGEGGGGTERGEMTGEQAAQLWLQSAKSELENRHSPLLKQRASVSCTAQQRLPLIS